MDGLTNEAACETEPGEVEPYDSHGSSLKGIPPFSGEDVPPAYPPAQGEEIER